MSTILPRMIFFLKLELSHNTKIILAQAPISGRAQRGIHPGKESLHHIWRNCRASFLAGWFGFYIIQAPQLNHVSNGTGYQLGFNNGFAESIREIYYFNNQPANLVVADHKDGLALTNGTAVKFIWFDPVTNKTLGLGLKAHQDLGQKRMQGTLYLMTSPVKWPQQIIQAFNMTQPKYMVFQTSGQSYSLEPNP